MSGVSELGIQPVVVGFGHRTSPASLRDRLFIEALNNETSRKRSLDSRFQTIKVNVRITRKDLDGR